MIWLSLVVHGPAVSPVSTATSDIVSYILGYGVLGVAAVLLALGYIVPRPIVNDLKAENHELKAALQAERDRAYAAVTAAVITKDILAAIQIGQNITQGKGP